ncbi:TRI25 ligase, partial [Atractosteus spatula]|nr:TRI25 ligase [Atractosteus spatula]
MTTKLWTEEQFNCPVCLDLPKDPVTIPCGHSYCMECIKDYWEKDDHIGIYSCPQCRQTFCPKPAISRNTMLAEAVEQLKKGGPNSLSQAVVQSSLEVPCDVCQDKKLPAVKSCLVCLASYCEEHIRPHYQSAALKRHELIGATGQLDQKICSEHKYLQEFYCRTDQKFICWLCTSSHHKGHDTVSTKTERTEKQKRLVEVQTEIQQRIQERQKELKDLKKAADSFKRSAEKIMGESEDTLTELIHSIERMRTLVNEILSTKGQEKVSAAEEVIEQLEKEITDLKKRESELRQLACSEDHIHFLETYPSYCESPEAGDLPSVTAHPEASFEPVGTAVIELRERLEDICTGELGKISKTVNETLLLTLGDSSRANRGAGTKFKADLLKIFSVLGPKNTERRERRKDQPLHKENTKETNVIQTSSLFHFCLSPLCISSIAMPSLGIRTTEKRGQVFNLRTSGIRNRDEPSRLNSSAPRNVDRQVERASVNSSAPRNVDRQDPEPLSRTDSVISLLSLLSRMLTLSIDIQSLYSTVVKPITCINVDLFLDPPTPNPANTRGIPTADNGVINSLAASLMDQGEINPFLDSATPNLNDGGVSPWAFVSSSTTSDLLSSFFFSTVREISVYSLQAPQPRTRPEFLKYSYKLVFDPDTAHRRLVLSEGNTKATLMRETQPYPRRPERFDGWTQVLCKEGLSGTRCYWEIEWRGRGSSVGVAYRAMPRQGGDAGSGLGYNDQSWSLELSDTCCSALHKNEKKDILVPYSPRIGVYLDYNAGTLSFYSIADTMSHLHTFQAIFVEPLYPGFGVGSGVGVGLDFALGQFSTLTDSVRICN